MSITTSLQTAVSGLQAAQRQMQVVSGNVSNANVDGYSRKTADPQTLVVGTRNAGVDLSTVRREVDSFLDARVREEGTKLSNLEALTQFHSRIQELFGTLGNDSSLANGLNRLQTSLEALAVEPTSAAARNDVIEAAQELARQFNRFTRQTQSLRGEADNQIGQAVQTVNSKLTEIGELNVKISSALATDEPTGELEDQRDKALSKLSELMEITTFERSTGEMVVMNGNGQLLVDRTANSLDFSPTGGFAPGTSANAVTLSSTGDTLGKDIGGRLGALIEVRDEALPNFQADIDRLAAKVRDQVNEAHNRGTYSNAPAGTITGSRDFVDSGGTVADGITSVSGSFTIVETDNAGDVVSSTAIDLDTAGAIADIGDLVTEINNQYGGAVASFTGNQLSLSAPSGRDIALDTGDARIDGDLGERNFSHYFALNDFFQTPNVPSDPVASPGSITGAAQTIQVRGDIAADQDLLARARVHTTVGAEAVPAGDPTIVQKMAGILDDTYQFADPGSGPGNLDARSATLAGYAGDILQFQARESARIENNAEFQRALRQELKFRADAKSGVNIDEEMSNLLTFQQAYNASARVVSTAQEMFNTLTSMVR